MTTVCRGRFPFLNAFLTPQVLSLMWEARARVGYFLTSFGLGRAAAFRTMWVCQQDESISRRVRWGLGSACVGLCCPQWRLAS